MVLTSSTALLLLYLNAAILLCFFLKNVWLPCWASLLPEHLLFVQLHAQGVPATYNCREHVSATYNCREHILANYNCREHVPACYNCREHVPVCYNCRGQVTACYNCREHVPATYNCREKYGLIFFF